MRLEQNTRYSVCIFTKSQYLVSVSILSDFFSFVKNEIYFSLFYLIHRAATSGILRSRSRRAQSLRFPQDAETDASAGKPAAAHVRPQNTLIHIVRYSPDRCGHSVHIPQVFPAQHPQSAAGTARTFKIQAGICFFVSNARQ